MGGSEKFWFYWRTKKYRAGVHQAEGTLCLYHVCSKEDGGLAVGSAVKCRKAIFAYVAQRKSSSCTLYVCWNRAKKKKKKKIFDFESLVLRKFRKITAISHPCDHYHIYTKLRDDLHSSQNPSKRTQHSDQDWNKKSSANILCNLVGCCNTTYSPAHSISKQGSRYGPLVCPSKPSSGVCRGFVPDIQICGTHGRKNLVSATIISNEEEEEGCCRFKDKNTNHL